MSDDVKAVHNDKRGWTDNFFGGQGKPDGPGHGHIRADEEGNVTIIRDSYTPGEPNARQNATELDSRGPNPGSSDK